MALPVIAKNTPQTPTRKNSPTASGVSNVVVFPKKSTRDSAPSHELFTNQYAEAGLQPNDLTGTNDNQSLDEREKARRIAQRQAEYASAMEAAAHQEEMFEQQQAAFAAEKVTAAEQMRGQKGSLAGKAATQAAAVALNTPTALWMTSWHTWAYLTFQIPLAALSIILFGLTVSLEQSWLTRQFSSLLSLVSLSPQDFFMVTNMILWGLSLFGLIVTMFAYLMRGQSPLGGDKMTAKMFAILGCLMGYSLPLFNLFPWIGIYIFVMWTSRD